MAIIPRIQRGFHFKQVVLLQGWHASHRSESGVIKIPLDSTTMNHIEYTWADKFKDEVQSIRLSIAMDGVNLYSLQNTNYFVWTVVVINNNIPQWLSEKNEHLMLDLIVLGRRQVKIMDVYLQPLIDKFKQLWEGIHVYDVSRPILMQRSFTLHGICAYAMHDYP
jgi:hypothetical protein